MTKNIFRVIPRPHHIVLLIVAIFSFGAILVINGSSRLVNQSTVLAVSNCIIQDKKVLVDYPVSGYFIRPQADSCIMTKMIQPMHQIGADTLIVQGGYMDMLSVADFENESSAAYIKNKGAGYRAFLTNTRSGLPAIKEKQVPVKTSSTTTSQKIRLDNAYLYGSRMALDPAVRNCSDRSGTTKVGNITYTWYLVPAGLADSVDTCDSPSGVYDIIVTMVGAQDPIDVTMSVAREYNMVAYLGLPSVQDVPTMMNDGVAKQRFTQFTKIVMKDWQKRYGSTANFAGLYQSTEANLTTNPAMTTLNLYDIQHKLIADIFLKNKATASKATVLISPFARTLINEPHPATVAEITVGAKKIADTARRVGVNVILAPQDGAGAGRVGLYTNPSAQIRPIATQYKGTKITDRGVQSATLLNKDVYMANTADVYRAVVQAGVTTWANIEAFTPGTPTANGSRYTYARKPTDKATYDEQITQAAPYVRKLISFSWKIVADDNSSQNESLFGAISRRGDAPLLAAVTTGSGSIQAIGYNLNTGGNSYLIVTDITNNNKVYRLQAPRATFKFDPGPKLQVVSVAAPDIKPGSTIRVQVANSYNGRTSSIALRY